MLIKEKLKWVEDNFTFPKDKQNLDVKEVATIAGDTAQTWKSRVRNGEIKHIRFSNKILIPVAELKRYLAEKLV